MNSHRCPPRRGPRSPADIPMGSRLSCGDATHTRRRSLHPIAFAGCSPAMRNRSEEAAPPGLPATLARLGNLSSLPSGQLLQNQPCAITGSVTSTPAVKALSLIPNFPSIKIRGASVRKLWTMEVPCGRWRKTWRKFRIADQNVFGAGSESHFLLLLEDFLYPLYPVRLLR